MSAGNVKLIDLISRLQGANLFVDQKGSLPSEISHYTTDTREIEGADLFIAYRGVRFDAHSRVPELSRQQPECVFIIEDQRCFEVMPDDSRVILVMDSREAWSYLAALRYGNPQEKLKMVGVTGTNGKTSTVWFLRQILKAKNIPCMTLGTIGVYCGDEILPANHTTPDPDELFRNLAVAVERGIVWAAMEVSSHAIVQRRLGPLRFDAVAFTSFSRDHLDFHASMKEYFAAKWELFSFYRKPSAPGYISTTVLEHLPKKDRSSFPFYGPEVMMEGKDGYSYTIEESLLNHSRLKLNHGTKSYALTFGFGGDFVMDNFTAAFALVDSLLPLEQLDGTGIHAVPGRFEPVPAATAHRLAVIVDYAHTPDALEKTLQKLKEMTKGKLWVVFGCGGDRDNGKRPLMGAIADALASEVVLTSDNPRTEKPMEIIQQVLKGIKRKSSLHVIEERRAAIEYACLNSKAEDCILIAGKGHEDYQILGTTKYPFDDKIVATEALNRRT